MSGRFTFTAGNTLTAAQLNTNVMDGIPFRYQQGTVSVPMTGGTTWSTGAANVTGLTGFTIAPYVYCTPISGVSAALVAHVDTNSTTGITIRVNYAANSATNRSIRWLAIQATSTTAEGS